MNLRKEIRGKHHTRYYGARASKTERKQGCFQSSLRDNASKTVTSQDLNTLHL